MATKHIDVHLITKTNDATATAKIKELSEKIRAVEKKIEKIVEGGGKVGLNDPLTHQLKELQAKRRQMMVSPNKFDDKDA